MQLTNAQAEGASRLFASHAVNPTETARAVQAAYQASQEIIDPHTAVGLGAAHALAGAIDPAVPIVTLATAHPAKFPDAVERAIGLRPALPARVGDLFGREESYVELAGDYAVTRDHVLAHAAASGPR
jgi:threonine synthase